jgi:ATP-dependent RNA helicase DeaD
MPPAIRKITSKYLHDPVEVTVKSKTQTAENITQRYLQVAGPRKMDALTRLLEVEPFEAMIVFVRTKQATEEVAERLKARGFAAAASTATSRRRSVSERSTRSRTVPSTS